MLDPTYELSDAILPSLVARNHVSLLFNWGETVRAVAVQRA
jgi:hypothetical protein